MLNPVTDLATTRRLDDLIHERIDEGYLVKKDWLARLGYTAVVLDSAMHLDQDYADQFAGAVAAAGYQRCYAVATEPIEGAVRHYELPATPKGLLQFSEKTFMHNFALLPEDGRFVILCTVDDYIIVAGERCFVEKACGGDIAAARAGFRDAIEDRHRAIADLYE